MTLFLVVLGGLFLVCYIVFPMVIRFTHKGRAYPRLEPLTPSDLPPVLADYIYSTANGLRQDGFVPEAYVSIPNAVENAKLYLIMLTNRAAGDMAIVTAILTQRPSRPEPRLRTCYVSFCTDYVSGKSVTTNTTTTISVFKRLPGKSITWMGAIQDPHLLYQIHRHILACRTDIVQDDTKVISPEGEALPYLSSELHKSFEQQVALGIFYRDEADGETIFRPTWFGAYYMTWQLLWPISAIRKMMINHHANAVIRSYRAVNEHSLRF